MSDVDEDDYLLWDKLALGNTWMQAIAAGQVKNPATIAKLSKNRSALVRVALAGNNHTGPEILARLSRDTDTRVRRIVALAERTPREPLEFLSRDEDFAVRTTALNRVPGQVWFGVPIKAIVHYLGGNQEMPSDEELETLRELPQEHVDAMFPLT